MQPAADGLNPATPYSDLDLLLEQAQSGDRIAFAAILRSKQAMVFSIARNFLRNDGHAEDVAQDVFLELHRNLQTLESGAHLVSWLRQVTGRKCIDQSRRAWFRRWVDIEDPSHRAKVATPESATSQEDPLLHSRIRRLIGKLPEKTRMMIILRFQEEMEPNEIAESLQVPVGTVKSTIHRGLETVRRHLGGSAGNSKKKEPCLKTI
jgi:RNA polymerase sigma-70 factor (ECF subfamily)